MEPIERAIGIEDDHPGAGRDQREAGEAEALVVEERGVAVVDAVVDAEPVALADQRAGGRERRKFLRPAAVYGERAEAPCERIPQVGMTAQETDLGGERAREAPGPILR